MAKARPRTPAAVEAEVEAPRERPLPPRGGGAPGWACGLVCAPGQVNVPFDKPAQPRGLFGVSTGTGGTTATEVRRLLRTGQMGPDWRLPARMERNPRAGFVVMDGMAVGARPLPPPHRVAPAGGGMPPHVPAPPGEDGE